MTGACAWDQGEGAACAPKSERMSCLVSFLRAGVVVGVVFAGGAWKSSEKISFSDAGAGAGADADAGVGIV